MKKKSYLIFKLIDNYSFLLIERFLIKKRFKINSLLNKFLIKFKQEYKLKNIKFIQEENKIKERLEEIDPKSLSFLSMLDFVFNGNYEKFSFKNRLKNFFLSQLKNWTNFFNGSYLMKESSKELSKIVFMISNEKHNKLKILEFGSGTGGTTEEIVYKFQKTKLNFVISDNKLTFVRQLDKRLSHYSKNLNLSFMLLDLNKIEEMHEKFDVILLNNTLHCAKNITSTLKKITNLLLKKNGYLLISENIRSKYKTYLPFELIYNLLPEYRNLKSYVNSSSKKGLMDIKNWKIKFHKNNMLLTKKIIILNPWTAIFVLKKDKNYS